MAESTEPWGRVSDGGVVEVRIDEQWLPVGAYPDATPEEALSLFVRKFDDLEAQVSLAEQRLKANAPAKDLSRSINRLRQELDTPNSVGDYQSLRARVDLLEATVSELSSVQAKQREEALAAAQSQREALVLAMEQLAAVDPSAIRWKDATAQMTSLFDQWKALQSSGPRLPKATAEELWKRFRNARSTLDRARRNHFQERDKVTKEVKATKRELIEKAQALSSKGAEGIGAYRELLEQWKKAPRGNRATEDQLWAEFKAAGDVLYGAKAAKDEADDEANRENGEAKARLVTEFSDILTETDPRRATERLRAFHDRFRAIGPVPRGMVKSIDAEIRKFDQHVKKLEAEHWQKTDPEKQARSQNFLDQIQQQIDSLEQQKAAAETAGDRTRAQELADEIDTKIAWKRVLTEA